MPYCTDCGNEILENDRFCSGCGRQAQQTADIPREPAREVPPKANISTGFANFINALAYIPGLFWVPLLIYPNNQRARQSSAQGLWISIFSFLAVALAFVLWFVFAEATGFDGIIPFHFRMARTLIYGRPVYDFFTDNMLMIIPAVVYILNWVIIGICSFVGFVRGLQSIVWQVPIFGRLNSSNKR